MAKQPSQGKCAYCRQTIAKSGMKRHLAACKERKMALAAEAAKRGWQNAKLLHLLVEGRDLPMYWMHIEIPAHTTLYDLDGFLRDTWLECCGHLSMFRIGKKEYQSMTDDDIDSWTSLVPGEGDSGEEDVIEDIAMDREPEPTFELAKQELARLFSLVGAPAEKLAPLLAELEQKYGPDSQRSMPEEESIEMIASAGRALGLPEFMVDLIVSDLEYEANRRRDMSVPLGQVLTPGLKLLHEYDFGSTTELALTVVAEREGKTRRKITVDILAQNDPPEIMCGVCGKNPAVVVCMWYCSDDKGWLCQDCARKHKCGDEGFLPVVNSPRVGVCGYTGDDLDYLDFLD